MSPHSRQKAGNQWGFFWRYCTAVGRDWESLAAARRTFESWIATRMPVQRFQVASTLLCPAVGGTSRLASRPFSESFGAYLKGQPLNKLAVSIILIFIMTYLLAFWLFRICRARKYQHHIKWIYQKI